MLYLSGALRPELPELGVGYIGTPMQGYVPGWMRGVTWAADTGCFAKPDAFSLPVYLDWLAARAPYRDGCLFATAPDVVGDAEATLEAAGPCLPELRAMGYRAALVAQDGLERLAVPWDWFDCLFVGGTTQWKLSEAAYALQREAKGRGKWTHMGRVNSSRRLRAAAMAGYDSADGTYVAFAPDRNAERVRRWLAHLRLQPTLELWVR